jgi:uncharacterized protein (TIGR02444 family)
MALEFEDHPFWDFSLRVYGTKGVSEACIGLQERRGIDVNLVLFSVWNGESGRGMLTAAELGKAVAASAEWNRAVVCGLRAVRDAMKDGVRGIAREYSDPLRKQVLGLEVECEHAEQLALARAVKRTPEEGKAAEFRAADAVANVLAYFHRHGFAPDGTDAAEVATILVPAFPDLDHEALEDRCRAAR